MMKKTFISAVILTALLATGCQDKDSQAKIEQLNQTVAQLTEQNKQLELDLLAQKVRADNMIPAIFAEEDVVFKKSETIKYPKSKEDDSLEEGTIDFSISTLKTNIDWLDTLLWEELTRKDGKVPTREAVMADYQKNFDETKKEMIENPIFGFDENNWVGFIGQKEKLATFAIGYYTYSGGAHGIGANRYFTIDMTTHRILTLSDLFDKKAISNVKERLWNVYTRDGMIKDEELSVNKADFNVSDNIYLDHNGIHFIYNVYEIASYAEGEQDLTLNWWQAEDLLKPSFKQQNYVKFASGDEK